MVCILYYLQKTPFISIYNIYQLVFIVGADSVLSVERNKSLYLTSTYFNLKDFFLFLFMNPFSGEMANISIALNLIA